MAEKVCFTAVTAKLVIGEALLTQLRSFNAEVRCLVQI